MIHIEMSECPKHIHPKSWRQLLEEREKEKAVDYFTPFLEIIAEQIFKKVINSRKSSLNR